MATSSPQVQRMHLGTPVSRVEVENRDGQLKATVTGVMSVHDTQHFSFFLDSCEKCLSVLCVCVCLHVHVHVQERHVQGDAGGPPQHHHAGTLLVQPAGCVCVRLSSAPPCWLIPPLTRV